MTLQVDEEASIATVLFTPDRGYHLYMPGWEGGEIPVEVTPLPDEGITWNEPAYEDEGDEITKPYAVTVHFTRDGGKRLRIKASWQACDNMCNSGDAVLVAEWVDASAVPPETSPVPVPVTPAVESPPSAPPLAPGERRTDPPTEETPFPVVHGDVLPGAATATGTAFMVKGSWFATLLLVFGFGVGLAFTPCVLPIIPLTISVIGGGAAGKASRGRLTVMLTAYVLGLALTYGAAGAVSGSLGKAVDLDAAFRMPVVVWAIAIFFLVLAAGMLGVFELQPPAWMERIRGGAAQKSGTLLGAFLLGALAAVIASPCTGPFVVAMLTYVATTGSAWTGFLLFFTLGLGMGAVFFAAGSLNLLARPGPWMVWVRYAFGVILVGVALYFLANAGVLTRVPLFVAGFAIALLTWALVERHLVKGEGERVAVARKRGALLAVSLAVVTGVVAHLTAMPEETLSWTRVKDVAELQAEVDRARAQSRPVIVDVWATWCGNCKDFDHVMETHASLRTKLADFVRIKIDETDDKLPELRRAVGLPEQGQPRMAFIDPRGRIRRALDVAGLFQGDADLNARELERRIDFVAGQTGPETARRP